MFISKASCRNGESKKFIALVGAKTALTCEGRQTAPSHASQYRAKNVNLRNLGLIFLHGTMLAQKECLYEKEATGEESKNEFL